MLTIGEATKSQHEEADKQGHQPTHGIQGPIRDSGRPERESGDDGSRRGKSNNRRTGGINRRDRSVPEPKPNPSGQRQLICGLCGFKLPNPNRDPSSIPLMTEHLKKEHDIG